MNQNTAIPQTKNSSPAMSLDLAIGGMSCASCASTIEKALDAVPEVSAASVNLATEQAHVELSANIDPQRIVQAVVDAGYEAEIIARHVPRREEPLPGGWHVVFAVVLTLPLAIPMTLDLFGTHVMLPGWLQWLLATPVQFWLGARFYRAGWKALMNRSGNMDLLVAIGTSAAYGL